MHTYSSFHRRLLGCLPVLLLLLWLTALPVSANAPAPAATLDIAVENAPAEAVFADLLLPFGPGDPHYAEADPLLAEELAIPADSEWVALEQDGYRSVTFHYEGADAQPALTAREYTSYKYASFFNLSSNHSYGELHEFWKGYDTFRVALLDKDGRLLQISEPFSGTVGNYSFVLELHYDTVTNTAVLECYENGEFFEVLDSLFASLGDWLTEIFKVVVFVISVIAVIFAVVLSVKAELLISLFFRPNSKEILTILTVNVITQLLIRVLFATVPLSYWTLVFILEVAVYLVEWVVYCKRLRNRSWKQWLLFSVLANTVSLLIGLGFNALFY